jgi:hypothetical protein
MQTLKKNFHYFYLLLSLVGGGFTFYYVMLGTIEQNGRFDVIEFVKCTWTDNPYAKSITLDFWTGATAGTIFIIMEGIRLKVKRFWLYVLFTFLIGFAFAFPLFLYVRGNYLNKIEK